MNLTVRPGEIGQIQGPFTNNDIINFGGNKQIKLGIIIGEKDLLSLGTFTIKIRSANSNEEIIQFGQNGIYELTEPTLINTIVFPQGAPESLIVDYVILES